ncbi:uncharacterized protein RCC_02591 [Ramularia collo-cygni]|uniref:Thioesterase domain-containing protein n=1 Tax=Ramularia collo-cygni TaxID=112498 RepID=A0A2D3UZR6_9PEZI|nr:uncharacterized protein RCC_02591 [Ramularia collo-cygni]CZT16756.1 uncharacterized protein RCC_02591 [Ramularia collo-cygni]
MSDTSDTDGIARIESFKNAHLAMAPEYSFAAALWPPVHITSASRSTTSATFSTRFNPIFGNHSRTAVHGGAIATLFDSLTGCTLALVAEKGFWVRKDNNCKLSHLKKTKLTRSDRMEKK